ARCNPCVAPGWSTASIEPLEDLRRVLAEPRRRTERVVVRRALEYPGADHFDALAPGQSRNRQRHSQPSIVEAGQLDCLADAAHHPARNAGRAELGFPNRSVARREDRIELGLHGARMLTPTLRICEARIVEPVLAPEHAGKQLELALLHDAERKVPPVCGPEDGRCRLPAVADVAGPLERA